MVLMGSVTLGLLWGGQPALFTLYQLDFRRVYSASTCHSASLQRRTRHRMICTTEVLMKTSSDSTVSLNPSYIKYSVSLDCSAYHDHARVDFLCCCKVIV